MVRSLPPLADGDVGSMEEWRKTGVPSNSLDEFSGFTGFNGMSRGLNGRSRGFNEMFMESTSSSGIFVS